MPLNILILGAGIAGPMLAFLLQRACPAHTITILERTPALRASGLQLDLKAQGTPLMHKMGLLEAMRAVRVEEKGMEVVGARGEPLAAYGIKTSAGTEGISGGGLTREVEVMRGDMVRVMYEAGLEERKKLGGSEGGLRYEFGTTVKSLMQRYGGVDVVFSDGRQETFDLVVGADGQNSRTRGMAFGEDVSKESFKELGTVVAYFTVPRGGSDGQIAKVFFAARKRVVMVRNGGRERTQVYLFTNDNMEKIKKSYKRSVAEQKAVWAETFKDAGWDVGRFLEGMQTTNDFYSHQIAQVKLPALYKDRVVLVGDAGYCPSVLTGRGTTASFIGAYMLAGELSRHPDDVDAALKAYNEGMKVPVGLCQQLNNGTSALPSSPLAVWLIRNGIWVISTLKIDRLIMKMMGGKREKNGVEAWTLPEYPELNLSE